MTKLKRLLIIGISLILGFLLQFMLFPRIPNLIQVPNMMLCITFSIGFLYGKEYGMVTGLLAGYLLDALGSGTIGFHMLILCWIGYLNGVLSEKLESEVILLLAVLFLANELVFHLYTFVFSFLIQKSYTFGSYFQSVFMPEVLLTFILFIIYYGNVIYLSKRWELRLNKGAIRIV